MGYETGDDEVQGRGRVTTLTSHQSEILHSLIIGDSIELPKWLNSVSGTKKSAKSNPSCLVEGILSIGWHWGFECSKC